MTPYTPNFTLAGERNGQIGEDFSYYTLHASFWNTWYQDALGTVEDKCNNSPPGCDPPNIDNNARVRELMQ